MSIFIKKDDRVSVSIDGGTNVIWIRRKMDVGTKNRVQDALVRASSFGDGGAVTEVSFNVGQQNTVLLQANILAWEGPLFRDESGQPVPVSNQAIESMDPDDPLVDAVLSEINERNRKPRVIEEGKEVSPLSSTTGSSGNGKNASAQSNGHRTKAASHPASQP